MSRKFRLHFYAALLLVLCLQERLPAQITLDEDPTGVQYSLLPVFGYSSDLGLLGGALLQRVDYAEGVRPFSNSTTVDVVASFQKTIVGTFDHDLLDMWNTGIRSRFRFQGLRLLYSPWFGIGNDTPFSRSAYDEEYYFFEDRSVTFDYWGRRKLYPLGKDAVLEGQLLITASYNHPVSRGQNTLFAEQYPQEPDRGWINQAGLGVVIDTRNNEFDPSKGFRLEANSKWSGSLTASEYTFTNLFAEARAYLSLFRNITIAQKLEIQHSMGNVPVWKLPVVGNEDGLRGYIQDRFRGQSSILHILEMRAWVFELFEGQIRLGGQLFMDSGRVFSGSDRLSDLPSGLKHTFGIGGAMSVLNPDFILRGELAFSEEINRIYFGIGYLF